jgi:hypothetical protein
VEVPVYFTAQPGGACLSTTTWRPQRARLIRPNYHHWVALHRQPDQTGRRDRDLREWGVSPTVLKAGPYRLFFFSSDRGEPAHVHVARERRAAKFWLEPVLLEYSRGFAPAELTRVTALVREREAEIVRAWHAHFNSGR